MEVDTDQYTIHKTQIVNKFLEICGPLCPDMAYAHPFIENGVILAAKIIYAKEEDDFIKTATSLLYKSLKSLCKQDRSIDKEMMQANAGQYLKSVLKKRAHDIVEYLKNLKKDDLIMFALPVFVRNGVNAGNAPDIFKRAFTESVMRKLTKNIKESSDGTDFHVRLTAAVSIIAANITEEMPLNELFSIDIGPARLSLDMDDDAKQSVMRNMFRVLLKSEVVDTVYTLYTDSDMSKFLFDALNTFMLGATA
jgi:hypothetical protein